MKNFICYCGILISVVIIFTVFITCCRECKNAADFVRSYGWEIDAHPIECEEVLLPKEFDDVYSQYNELQKKASLDLLPYRGRRGVRYTFSVLNYQSEKGEISPRANVIMVDGAAIGGDVCTTELGGFMHSLNKSNP